MSDHAVQRASARASSGGISVSYGAFVAGLLGLSLFLTALRNGFAYDDVAIVSADERIHSLANLRQILFAGYWPEQGHGLYRPLTTLSFALDWSLAPGASAWFHFSNALMHGVASALVVLLLARLFAPAAALAGGLLFAVHPVHVEAVANVVGRADVLAAVFTLGAALLWVSESRLLAWSLVRTAGAAVLFALALLSKESAVMLPALLVLLDIARRSSEPSERGEYLRRNAAAFLALGVVVAVYLAVRGSVLGGMAPSRLDPAVEMTPGGVARVFTALQAWPHYFRLAFFPATLLADYGPRVVVPAEGITTRVLFGFILMAGCIAGGVLAIWRGYGRAALGLLWFPVAILPVSNLIVPIGVLVAERTLYLPSLAVSIGVAGAVTVFYSARAQVRRLGYAATGLVLTLLAARTLARIPEWESTDRVMQTLLRDRPDAFRGHWHLARTARVRGDTAAALQAYAEAMQIWPYRHRLAMEALTYAMESGHGQLASQFGHFAVMTWPADIGAHRLFAAVALDLGDTATAKRVVRAGLKLDAADPLLRRMNAVFPRNEEPAR